MAGEYEPNDSRNVTGAGGKGVGSPGGADQQEGAPRWGGDAQQSQSEAGHQQDQQISGQEAGVHFTPDAALNKAVSTGQQSQFDSSSGGQMGGEPHPMAAEIREHMEVIGADGTHVGTVDKVEAHRIKLTRADSGMGAHQGHHHYISMGLVAGVEGNRVRLSANGDVAYGMTEEE